MTVYDGHELVARAVVGDIVLTAGEQLVRTVLPAVESPSRSLEVRASFVAKNDRFGPWGFTLPVPDQWQRKFVLLVCDPAQSGLSSDKQQLIERLRIENWNALKTDRTISTIPAHVRPEDLPADPLGWCGFDVVLLAHEGFSELKESQLRMLLEWVEAGGSTCIVPGGGALKEYHARFLNQAAHSPATDQQYVLDSSGRLMSPAAGAGEPPPSALRRYGLGRIALIPGKLDEFLGGPESETRKLTAFLWKMRQDRTAEFLTSGTFLVKTDIPVDQPRPEDNQWAYNPNVSYANLRPKDMQLAQLPLQSGDQLLARLMPEGLRVIPMYLIGVILIVYVVMIGPIDWFLLGAIKRRKWTWISFPAVTIALTLGTVWLAEWYMRVSNNQRTVTFYDIGEEGALARRNRFEVLFHGSERFVTTEVNREIFTAMTLQRFSSAMWLSNQQAQMQQGIDQSHRFTRVADYIGRVPANYSVKQFVTQWTPQLNRRFAIPIGGDRPIEFDWNALADRTVFNPGTVTAGPAREELVRKVQQAFGPTASVAIFAGGKRYILAGDANLFQTGSGINPEVYNQAAPARRYYPGMNVNTQQVNFLEDVSLNALGGLFAVVSQVSPTGGKDFEDMALVDPSDPAQWLLVIAVARGNDLDVYRKLYTGEN